MHSRYVWPLGEYVLCCHIVVDVFNDLPMRSSEQDQKSFKLTLSKTTLFLVSPY